MSIKKKNKQDATRAIVAGACTRRHGQAMTRIRRLEIQVRDLKRAIPRR